MSINNNFDSKVKGLGDKSILTIHDFMNLDKAVYVSRRGNAESIDQMGSSSKKCDSSITDKKFEKAAQDIKKMMGDKSAIVARADASHYNFVNGNFYYYNMDFMRQNAATWIQKTDSGSYGKPVQKDHSMSTSDNVGRVIAATPFIYGQSSSDIWTPDGHIELIYYVSDTDAIDRMVDGRFRTLSVSASASPKDVHCSICGRTINDYDCEHSRGRMYKDEESGSRKESPAFWIWDRQRYNELSFVQKPADTGADNKQLAFINIDGKDMYDDATNDDSHFESSISIMTGVVSNGLIKNLMDSEENTVSEIYLQDSIVDETLLLESANDSTDGQTSSEDNSEANIDSNNLDCGCEESKDNNEDDNHPTNNGLGTHSKADVRIATLILIKDMIENELLSPQDAISVLFDEAQLYINTDSRDKGTLISVLDQELFTADAENATRRKSLPSSVFCGPNKTFPITDSAHVFAAQNLLSKCKDSSSTKSRILSCVNRKANALGCNSTKSKDNTQEDSTVAKLQFESVDELLLSPYVQKAIDEKATELEQKLDEIKKTTDEREDQFTKIAIDSIIELSVKLGKPSTSKIEGLDGEELKKATIEVSDKLKERGLDNLTYLLKDLREEASFLTKDKKETTDPNQQKVEDAAKKDLGDKDTQSDSNKEDKESKDSAETSSKEDKTEDKAGADSASTEELNQKDASDSKESVNTVPSFLKKVN